MNPDYFTKKQTASLVFGALLINFGILYFSLPYIADVRGILVSQDITAFQNIDLSEQSALQYPNAELAMEGDVASIGSDFVMVNSGILYKINIQQSTKIVERTLKPESEITQLTEEYQRAFEKNPDQNLSFPIIHTSEKVIKLSDIKAGDRVMVFSPEINALTGAKTEFSADIIARTTEPKQ